MSARRRKNPDTLTLALGVGAVGLLVAGGVWWYVSQQDDEAEAEAGRLLGVNRTFDKKSAKALAAAAVAARGGKRVGTPLSPLHPGKMSQSLRYEPSGMAVPSSDAPDAEDMASNLTQPFDPSAGAPT
jgi:hypothetical protein